MLQNSDSSVMTPGVGVMRHLPERYVDVTVVVMLVLSQLLASAFLIFVSPKDSGHEVLAVLASAVLLLADLTLLVRRRRPLFALVVTFVAFAIAELIHGTGVASFAPPFAPLIALYSFSLVNAPGRVVRVAALAWVWMVGVNAVTDVRHWSHFLAVIPLATLVAGVGASVGLYIGTRRKYVEQLTERAATLEREHNLLAERVVAEERVRIARDLHDVVSHHIALMVVQANAAQATFSSEPRKSMEMIDQVASSGRKALNEMRRMLGVLRTPTSPEMELSPSPGISELSELVMRTEEAGISVEFSLKGDPTALTDPIQLTCYRIVQESLTNVIKYAPSSLASVSVEVGEAEVSVVVTDDGPGSEESGSTGHGIPGMRERVALFGGRLFAGDRESGGFEVVAAIPISSAPMP